MEDFLDLWLRERVAGVYVTHNFLECLRLADRIMVLSRRPGRIKEVIEVPIPQRERTTKAAQIELAELGNRLWSLIRDEASTRTGGCRCLGYHCITRDADLRRADRRRGGARSRSAAAGSCRRPTRSTRGSPSRS